MIELLIILRFCLVGFSVKSRHLMIILTPKGKKKNNKHNKTWGLKNSKYRWIYAGTPIFK